MDASSRSDVPRPPRTLWQNGANGDENLVLFGVKLVDLEITDHDRNHLARIPTVSSDAVVGSAAQGGESRS